MLLFWIAYTFLYTTALWSHLDAPGASYISSVTARLGLPTSPSPIPIEVPAPTLIPTSTRIPVPDTIIFPASPLPTARLRHKALPLCYGGLEDDLASATGPATRTATGTSTDLIVNGPGLITRYLVVTSALAAALATQLVHSSPCLGAICILGLVCLSRVLFMMRRVAFESTATRVQASSRCPCSHGSDLNVGDVAGSENHSVSVDTHPSPSPPSPLSPPPIYPLKKLATMGPALTKTDRMIARKQRNRGRGRDPAKANGNPSAPRNNSPPSLPPLIPPPLEPVETDLHVWTVEDSSTIEYAPSVPRSKKRTPPVAKELADVD